MTSTNPTAVLETVAETLIEEQDPTEIDWNWGQGVLMTGVMRADSVRSDDRCRQFVKEWADHHRPNLGDHLAKTLHDVNFWTGGYPCLLLGEALDDDTYREMAERVIEYMFSNGPRMQNGAFGHNSREHSRQIWTDTAWHSTPLLAHGSVVFDEVEYLLEARRQLQAFSAHAQDTHSGLFNHYYDEEEDSVNGVYWGRGNGWMAMSYADVLKHTDESSWGSRDLVHQHSRLLDGLRTYQGDSGLWYQVIDEHGTYTETSASAMAFYSLVEVIRNDLYTIPSFDVEGTWNALAERVDDDGHVVGVSGGTHIGTTVEHYDDIPQKKNNHFGTGLFLMAAAAYAKLKNA